MRAVLRATLAARRRARPTAAENSRVSFLTLVRFMVPVPLIEETYANREPVAFPETVECLEDKSADYYAATMSTRAAYPS